MARQPMNFDTVMLILTRRNWRSIYVDTITRVCESVRDEPRIVTYAAGLRRILTRYQPPNCQNAFVQ